MQVVSVSPDRTVTLPDTCEELLKKGHEFMVFTTDDGVLLKQVMNADIRERALRESSEPPMTEEEIVEMVHQVREEIREGK